MGDNFWLKENDISRYLALTTNVISFKFKADRLIFYLSQLSAYLKSGIALADSVKILVDQTKKDNERNTWRAVYYDLSMGNIDYRQFLKKYNFDYMIVYSFGDLYYQMEYTEDYEIGIAAIPVKAEGYQSYTTTFADRFWAARTSQTPNEDKIALKALLSAEALLAEI